MKGTLHKTDEGWIVIYDQILGGGIIKRNQNSLPLHPDNIPTQAEDHFWIDGKMVEFEVVQQFMPYDNFKPIHKFAKLI